MWQSETDGWAEKEGGTGKGEMEESKKVELTVLHI